MTVKKYEWELKNDESGTMYTSGSIMFTDEERLKIEKEIRNERKKEGLYTEGLIPKDGEKNCQFCGAINPELFVFCKKCGSQLY